MLKCLKENILILLMNKGEEHSVLLIASENFNVCIHMDTLELIWLKRGTVINTTQLNIFI